MGVPTSEVRVLLCACEFCFGWTFQLVIKGTEIYLISARTEYEMRAKCTDRICLFDRLTR